MTPDKAAHMSHENTIVLHTYPDNVSAKMIQDILTENGIPSFLNDENVMGLDPVGGTEVRVFETDKATAEEIIAAK